MSTFTFETVSRQPVDNLKLWYNNPRMLGCHFVVYNSRKPSQKRQYAICSSLNPEVYGELMTLAWSVLQGTPKNFNYKMMLGRDVNWVNLTVESFEAAKGLASEIHTARIAKADDEAGKFKPE